MNKKQAEVWAGMKPDSAGSNPFETQVGGTHWTDLKIQPFEYSFANNLGPAEHTVVKYVSRWKNKNGIEDLKKARHVLDLYITHLTYLEGYF